MRLMFISVILSESLKFKVLTTENYLLLVLRKLRSKHTDQKKLRSSQFLLAMCHRSPSTGYNRCMGSSTFQHFNIAAAKVVLKPSTFIQIA